MFKHYSSLAIAISLAIGSVSSVTMPVNAYGIGTGYIIGAEQFPQGKATQVRQTIHLNLSTPDTTQIKIIIPEGIKVGNNIAVYNETQQRELSAVVRNNSGREIEIDLPQVFPPDTKITIDLNRVRLWGTARTYQVYSQPKNSSRPIYIGSAEFRLY
jgi:hypothetical protein